MQLELVFSPLVMKIHPFPGFVLLHDCHLCIMSLPHTQRVLNWTYYLFSQVNFLYNFLMLKRDGVFWLWLHSYSFVKYRLHSCFSEFLLTLSTPLISSSYIVFYSTYISLWHNTISINSLRFRQCRERSISTHLSSRPSDSHTLQTPNTCKWRHTIQLIMSLRYEKRLWPLPHTYLYPSKPSC